MSLTLAPGEGGTRLLIETDLAVLGKIGEFGQPVIKKKADTLLAEFARNLQSALAA
jgi:carbon monoxide dehydrogenase subunit G